MWIPILEHVLFSGSPAACVGGATLQRVAATGRSVVWSAGQRRGGASRVVRASVRPWGSSTFGVSSTAPVPGPPRVPRRAPPTPTLGVLDTPTVSRTPPVGRRAPESSTLGASGTATVLCSARRPAGHPSSPRQFSVGPAPAPRRTQAGRPRRHRPRIGAPHRATRPNPSRPTHQAEAPLFHGPQGRTRQSPGITASTSAGPGVARARGELVVELLGGGGPGGGHAEALGQRDEVRRRPGQVEHLLGLGAPAARRRPG